jgi:hypothetical protein
LGDQTKNNELGRACGTCGRQERCIQGFGEEGGGPEEKSRSRREDNIRIINYKLNINNYFFSAVLTFYTVNINCIAIKCKN